MDEKTFKTQISQSSKEVIDFYNRYAATWDDRFGNKRSTLEFHRIRLDSFFRIANLKKTDRIAELGVGTGPYLDLIAPQVSEIICIDGSDSMLNVLLEKHRNLSNIRILQMDLAQEPTSVVVQMDMLYCFGLIEHIIDTNTFLENCKKMLKNEGRLIIVTPNGRSPWYSAIRRLWRAGSHCSSDTYFSKEELDEVVGNHGFVPDAAVFWGFFPAGISDGLYKILSAAGSIFRNTWINKYSGGITASYVLDKNRAFDIS